MAEASVEWLSGEALEDLRALPGAVLVVFTAQWCPPCQELAPRLETLAGQHAARLNCYLVDVDRHPEPAQKYGVRGMPTLVLFVDGAIEATRVGALDAGQLEAFIASSL